MKKILRIFLYGVLLLFVILLIQFAYNEYQVHRLDRSYESETLSEKDQATIRELGILKGKYGSDIWPGFDEAPIPVILFNDRHEFIAGIDSAFQAWSRAGVIQNSDRIYFRRKAQDPQAFAVQTEKGWAGRFSTLDYLNRDILTRLRRELPAPVNRLMPSQMITKSNDYHVVALVHEMFHAFQAIHSGKKFERSNALAHWADRYPYQRDSIDHLFTREGQCLYNALKADKRKKKLEWGQKFLRFRKQRRKLLSGKMIAFEKRYEWLEGLAKYAEMEAYRTALSHNGQLEFSYDEEMPHWETDMKNLNDLGNVDGSTRFYLSGMAQARLLDQIAAHWKSRIMKEQVYQEHLIAEWAGTNL